MGVWTELVGVRRDLRLRAKWWHHAAVGIAWFSGLLVYLIVAGAIVRRPQKLTTANTYSLTLLNDATTRKTTTTLRDLDALSGIVGSVGSDGELVPLARAAGSDIRCESKAGYKADESRHRRRAELSRNPGLSGPARRRSRDTASRRGTTCRCQRIRLPSTSRMGRGLRKQQVRAFLGGMTAVAIWLVLYWNMYYRGVMPFYARHRQARKRRHLERHSVR